MQNYCDKTIHEFSWDAIDTILLDMDGTLLDKHFDDYFWEQYLPEHYSLAYDISVEAAKKELLARYAAVEDTLNWADTSFWSRELGLDIPELKLRINHLIGVHPYVIEFLEHCIKMRKKLYLVTNAHSSTLSIKLEKTALDPWFDQIICAEEIGLAKEEPLFWNKLEKLLNYDKQRTLLIDDTEKVLSSAQQYGMGHLLFVARPSSRQRVQYSCSFPSIEYFKELLPR
ncbi:HAD-IA family hydrolase [Desulfogranum marinum]|jgi:putative hydrolase of the HAD superfamily|uniref:HAD-IA family hydrolase n=1 Tax=Desulfogranum marinum TaxID=453220 RepID=UPI00196661D5|nr:HAD-IA family hydrolase [Desulfogranum marinum]MBM9512392.1 HAD-IA family hydrolase [Desulfogranum marinum]